MSHQVIITFDIDENKVQENAEREAGRQIAMQVIDAAFGSSSYNSNRMIKEYAYKAISEMLAECKDEIINRAVKDAALSITRSKITRMKLDKIADAVIEEGIDEEEADGEEVTTPDA